jgi:hypothetical protein
MDTNERTRRATDAAAEHASELKDTAKERAGDVANTVKEQAGEVAHEAAHQGREVLERAKHGLHEQAQARTSELSQSLRRLGGEVQALADGRPDEAGPVAGYVRQAATKFNDVAERVDREGVDGILEDVAEFGRRKPAVFLAAAGVAGFVVGRMIRAGRDASNGNGGYNGATPRAVPPPQQVAAGYGMDPSYTSNAPTTPMGTRS